MNHSRVRFFFFPPPLNRSLMGSPIPNRFTQTLDFPSPIRIIQTHKQIAFQNKNIAGYNLKTRKLNRSRHLSSFNESRQIKLLLRRYRGLQICTFLEQFLSSLNIFNLTTCNDHLEPTQIYPNTNKVCFVKGYANYIKICPQHFQMTSIFSTLRASLSSLIFSLTLFVSSMASIKSFLNLQLSASTDSSLELANTTFSSLLR